MFIDTHSQLWTQEALYSLPASMYESYKKIFGEKLDNLEESNTIQDMDKAGIDKSVVVAVDAETTFKYKVSNELLAKFMSKYSDRIIGFAGIDPHKGRVAIDELKYAVNELNLKGLKLMPHLMELTPDDYKLYPVYETAQELDIPILFHAGTQYHTGTKIKYCRPLYFDEVAVDFPDLKLIIAHFGWPWVLEAIAVALRNKNVYLNIAGWAPKYLPPELISYMNGPLKHKVLFGSDYPLLSRNRIINELKEINLKKETNYNLLKKNPAKILNL